MGLDEHYRAAFPWGKPAGTAVLRTPQSRRAGRERGGGSRPDDHIAKEILRRRRHLERGLVARRWLPHPDDFADVLQCGRMDVSWRGLVGVRGPQRLDASTHPPTVGPYDAFAHSAASRPGPATRSVQPRPRCSRLLAGALGSCWISGRDKLGVAQQLARAAGEIAAGNEQDAALAPQVDGMVREQQRELDGPQPGPGAAGRMPGPRTGRDTRTDIGAIGWAGLAF